jgi:D-alanyl-D-alanine carboxypeptidase
MEIAVTRRTGPLPNWARLVASLGLLIGLAGCGGGGGGTAYHARSHHYDPSRYYPPPGPPTDPWGPYIREASARFNFPELWIRKVMHQESGGQENVISWVGAMGLMQVMPGTYDELRDRYALGDDPFDPHNNILAGTAYLREMYDRFGSPGFLAAYNAGPNRLDSYLNTGRPLPAETVNYVASIAPLLGRDAGMTGPLAAYGGSRGGNRQMAARATPAGCDPDAAYNPDAPCTPLRPAPAQPFVVASLSSVPVPAPDMAPAPDMPSAPPMPPAPVMAEPLPRPAPAPAPARGPGPGHARLVAYVPDARPLQERMGLPVSYATAEPRPVAPSRHAWVPPAPVPGPPPGHWAIQVGAFANLATAQAAAEKARSAVPDLLRTATTVLPATAPFGGKPAFRARLSGLSQVAAVDACSRLSSRGVACMTVSPERAAF